MGMVAEHASSMTFACKGPNQAAVVMSNTEAQAHSRRWGLPAPNRTLCEGQRCKLCMRQRRRQARRGVDLQIQAFVHACLHTSTPGFVTAKETATSISCRSATFSAGCQSFQSCLPISQLIVYMVVHSSLAAPLQATGNPKGS